MAARITRLRNATKKVRLNENIGNRKDRCDRCKSLVVEAFEEVSVGGCGRFGALDISQTEYGFMTMFEQGKQQR